LSIKVIAISVENTGECAELLLSDADLWFTLHVAFNLLCGLMGGGGNSQLLIVKKSLSKRKEKNRTDT